MSDALADRDEEYLEQREELIQKAKESREEAEARHNALLEAAAEGEEAVIEEYDTAEIGDAELTVKTQINGEQMRKLDDIWGGGGSPGKQLDVLVDMLAEQTRAIEANGVTVESKADVRRFFRDFIDANDAQAATKICMERVIEEPNDLEDERRGDAVKSFRPERRGDDVRRDFSKRP